MEALVWSRLVELWFSVDEKTKETLAYQMELQAKNLAETKARVSEAAEWVEPLLGAYANDELGAATLRRDEEKGLVLESAVYTSRVRQYDRHDGKRVLLTIDPPLTGLELEPAAEGGFVVTRGQERYVLARVQQQAEQAPQQ